MYWNSGGAADGPSQKLQHHSHQSEPSGSSNFDQYTSGTDSTWNENEQKRKLAAALQASSPSKASRHPYETRVAESTPKSSLSGANNSREPVPSFHASPSPRHNIVSSTPRGAVGGHTVTTSKSQVLDLKRNDNSFHVIAKLIIDRFEDQFNLHTESITVTAGDRFHLDRVVPAKAGFVEAVQYRMMDCHAESTKPIHIVTRQCHALGLHQIGEKNLLYAPVGTVIKIDWSDGSLNAGMKAMNDAKPAGPDDLARQQLLAELREASNLMAESVTPEASKFWRNQVLELQAKLRALHEKDSASNSVMQRGTTTEEKIKQNDRLMASLWENTSYVPAKQEDMISNVSMNNSIIESRNGNASQQQNMASPLSDVEQRDVDFGLPMVDVVAPADLPGGYQFEAEIDNKHFLATVPAGGVRKGHTFSCLMREMKESDVPVGRWRDGLFDCFHYGVTHPMLLNSILCPLIALSQVEGRMELNVLGKKAAPGTPQTGIYSTRGTMITLLVLWVFLNSIIISGFEYKLHNFVSLSPADIVSLVLVNGGMIAFTLYATVNTRKFIREKYHIEEDKKSHRDIVSAIFCLPLNIAQMGRHTASYEDYNGACCNDTGVAQPKSEDNFDPTMQSTGGVVV